MIYPARQMPQVLRRHVRCLKTLLEQTEGMRDTLLHYGITGADIPGNAEDVLLPAFGTAIEDALAKTEALQAWVEERLESAMGAP